MTMIGVASTVELIAALAGANPGDVITLAPGTYAVSSNLACDRAGQATAPITVRAETLGTVVIDSSAVEGFHVTAPYWTFENLEMHGVCADDSDCEHAFHITGLADGVVLRGNRLVDFNAQVKGNGAPVGAGGAFTWPDDVLIEGNELYDTEPRQTSNPVTKLDIVGGRRWRVRANYLHDFAKGGGDGVSYAAFLKGNSRDGLMERNLVVCSRLHSGQTRIGLSLGGGGTGPDSICEDGTCSPEHQDGVLRNNLIVRCSDVGIYLNEAARTKLYFNTVYATGGIDVRYQPSTADIRGNVLDGMIRDRELGTSTRAENVIGGLDALFTDPGALDFSLANGATLVDQGTAVPEVTDDYCGNLRDHGPPDLGAVEFDGDGPCDTTVTHPAGGGGNPGDPDAGILDLDAGGGAADGGDGGCCQTSDHDGAGAAGLALATVAVLRRRRRRKTVAVAAALAGLLALGGCKKAKPPAGKPADAAAAAPDAAAAAPDAAVPVEPDVLTPPVPAGKAGIQIKGLQYEGFEAPMLPAVREDGAQIAALWLGDDGGRGYLDLRLQIVDVASNKVVEDRRLADPEETNGAEGDDGNLAPAVLATARQRVADANALLAGATWRALEPNLAPPADPEAPITAAGISWSLDERLHLTGKRGGKVVFDRTYTQLTGKPAPGDRDDDMCPDLVVLDAVHVDTRAGLALISFGRRSGHNCGAPGADLAAIALPK